MKTSSTSIISNDFIIGMFLTGGLCDEVTNCIHTLTQYNLKNKLIVRTLDDTAEQCISSLGVTTDYKQTELGQEADFASTAFYNIVKEKIIMIKYLLETYQKPVLYIDTDIVFLKDPTQDINAFITNNEYDVVFQSDSQNFEPTFGNVCAGFMLFMYNDKSLELLNKTLDIMNSYTNYAGGDQTVINNVKNQFDDLRMGLFENYEYPNGARYFKNLDTVYQDRTPIIVHNNWIKGLDEKIQRFKEHGLWFI